MSKLQKLSVKVGDVVQIITGSDKNKTGEVLKISSSTKKVLVKGVNLKFKHIYVINHQIN